MDSGQATVTAAVTAADASGAAASVTRALVLAYEGTEELVGAVWDRMCALPHKVAAVPERWSLRESLEDAVADSSVAADFTLVPPDCVPCSPVAEHDLLTPTVYIDRAGAETWLSRLPMPFYKGHLADFLPDHADADGEELARLALGETETRAVQVSFLWGNYVTPVLRANPCEHLIIEGMLRKKFLTFSPLGFRASEALLRAGLLK